MAKILVADDEQKIREVVSGNTQNLTVTKLPRPQMA